MVAAVDGVTDWKSNAQIGRGRSNGSGNKVASVQYALERVPAAAEACPIDPVADAVHAETGVPVFGDNCGCKVYGKPVSGCRRRPADDDWRRRRRQPDQALGVGIEPDLQVGAVVMDSTKIVVIGGDDYPLPVSVLGAAGLAQPAQQRQPCAVAAGDCKCGLACRVIADKKGRVRPVDRRWT